MTCWDFSPTKAVNSSATGNLAATLNVQERTIIDYLDHLESVFLVAQAQFFSEE